MNSTSFIEIEVGIHGLEEWIRRYGISDGWHVLDSKQEPKTEGMRSTRLQDGAAVDCKE